MHRQTIMQLLSEYETRYPEEAETTERYRQFVVTHEDCFDRSQLGGHITGSAWLLNRAGTHVLLTHHRKLDIWVQLGGHADGDSNPLAVAMREAREESGIGGISAISDRLFDIDIHLIPQRKSEPEHYHYDARFLLQTTTSDAYIVSDESHALEWVDITQLKHKTTEASMIRMAEKYDRPISKLRQSQSTDIYMP